MEYVVIITVIALAQFIFFGIRVGQMRGKHGVSAPDTIGDPEFMRMFRIHQNTMEQLVVFLPALWLFVDYWEETWGVAIGRRQRPEYFTVAIFCHLRDDVSCDADLRLDSVQIFAAAIPAVGLPVFHLQHSHVLYRLFKCDK